MKFQGTFTALVTPFTADGSKVDFASMERLIEFQMPHVDGFVVCGSTGEAMTLSEEEYFSVVEFVAKASLGKKPCIAGIGSNDTKRAVAMAQRLDATSCDGILVVAPPYNKPPQRGIIAHFTAVHAATSKPLIAYNIPGRTGVNIAPTSLAQLFQNGVIQAVKESSGSVDTTLDIVALTGGQLPVMSGEDSQVVAIMANGGTGVISASANVIPELFQAMTSAGLRGDFSSALQAQLASLPMIRAMFSETNPIPAKAALAIMGVIDHAAPRLPLMEAEASTKERIKQLLAELQQLNVGKAA